MKWFTPKYRIKKVTDGNKSIRYYPQVKRWYGWAYIKCLDHTFNKIPIVRYYIADAEDDIKREHEWWLAHQIEEIEYINVEV